MPVTARARAQPCTALYQGPDDEDVEPHYRRLLAETVTAQLMGININCAALADFSEDCARLYEQLIKYPQEVTD